MSFDAATPAETPTSLVPSTTAADSTAQYVNVSCLDFLLIEMVPLAERMARRAERIERGHVEALDDEADDDAPASRAGYVKKRRKGKHADPAPGPVDGAGAELSDVYKEDMSFRLDRLGYRVGQGLSERFSRDRPRFVDHLDVIKFLCKELWIVLFRKQIDNLKTNHRGIFVLTDTHFRPLTRMSLPPTPTPKTNQAELATRAQPHLNFPCGIIRGALSTLGITSTVQAECLDVPTVVFEIKMAK